MSQAQKKLLTVRRTKGAMGQAIGLCLGVLWAASALFFLAHFTPPLHDRLSDGKAFQWGAAFGGAMFVLYQTLVSTIVFGVLSPIPYAGWVFMPVKVAYYLFVWPGLELGRIFKLIEWQPKHDAADDGHRPKGGGGDLPHAKDMQGACPFEGRVVAHGDVAFHDAEYTRGETVMEIHEDWRVSSEKFRYWGWIDADGAIHEGAGVGDRFEIDHEGTARSGIVARLQKGGCYNLTDKKIGDWQKTSV